MLVETSDVLDRFQYTEISVNLCHFKENRGEAFSALQICIGYHWVGFVGSALCNLLSLQGFQRYSNTFVTRGLCLRGKARFFSSKNYE